jgi:hypothetical protein
MESKNCTKCGEVKHILEFRPIKTKAGTRSECILCERASNRAYHHKNADRRNSESRQYYADHQESLRKRAADWRTNNVDQVRIWSAQAYASDPNGARARNIAWKAANKHRVIAAIARRTASKLLATPKWASNSKIEEFYFAAQFLSMVTGEWYHVDHIVPLQSKRVCGLHCEANLQVLRGSENRSKSNSYWPDMP